MCTFLGKKVVLWFKFILLESSDDKDNMMINIMIVKAVIKKNVPATCFFKSYLYFLSVKQKIPENITSKMSKLHRYVMYIYF